MPNDINELDVTDAGLKAVMGDRFHDATENAQSKRSTEEDAKRFAQAIEKEFGKQKPKDKPVDEQWQPVKPDPNWMDKLKDAVKWGLVFGCLSCLVFYWKEAGLMAESIAVPTIAICTALAGFGIGKNARCK